jgi:hypothetical protein
MPSSEHIERAAGIDVSHIRQEMAKVNTFNAKVAVLITKAVGSMWMAYCFTVLSLCSLPAVLSAFHVFHSTFPNWLIKTSVIALVAWIAQTFLQLVLLSVIMVGQDVQSQASDARAQETDENTKNIVGLLDIHTEGGLKDLADLIDARLPAPQSIAAAVKKAPVAKKSPRTTKGTK